MSDNGSRLYARVMKNPPEFLQKKIETLDLHAFEENEKKFVKEESWHDSTAVNVFEVLGTTHPSYQGMTWAEFLKWGRRMEMNLHLADTNPGYYYDRPKKAPTMYYTRINGKLYISDDGNHRTCISKALFHFSGHTELHGVEVREYLVDDALPGLSRDLKQALVEKRLTHIELQTYRKKTFRDDGVGWHRDFYDVGVELVDRRTAESRIVMAGEVPDLIERVRGIGFLKRMFLKGLGDI